MKKLLKLALAMLMFICADAQNNFFKFNQPNLRSERYRADSGLIAPALGYFPSLPDSFHFGSQKFSSKGTMIYYTLATDSTPANYPFWYNGSNWHTVVGGTAVTGGSSGTVKGAGVAGRVAYWAGSDSITSSGDFLYNNTTKELSIVTNAPLLGTPMVRWENTNANSLAFAAQKNDLGNLMGLSVTGSNYVTMYDVHNIGVISTTGTLRQLRLVTNGDIENGGNTPIVMQPGGFYTYAMGMFHKDYARIGRVGIEANQMTVTPSGQVGIGTYSPQYPFHTYGDAAIQNGNLTVGINPGRWLVNSGGNADVFFSSGITLNDSSKAISIPRYSSPGAYRRIYMYNSASDGLVFGGISNDGTARTRLYNSTGNTENYIELNNYDNSYGGTYFYQPVKTIGVLSPSSLYTEYKFVGGSNHNAGSTGGRNEFMGLFPQVATQASVENIGFSVNAYTTGAGKFDLMRLSRSTAANGGGTTTDYFTVKGSGYVGILTSDPLSPLHIKYNSGSIGAGALVENLNTTSYANYEAKNSGGEVGGFGIYAPYMGNPFLRNNTALYSTTNVLLLGNAAGALADTNTYISLRPGGFAENNEVARIHKRGMVLRDPGEGSASNLSALLDMQSSSRGFLPPRMTTLQQNAISDPAEGLLVWNNDSSRYMLHTASAWRGLAFTGEGGGSSDTTKMNTMPVSGTLFNLSSIPNGAERNYFTTSGAASITSGSSELTLNGIATVATTNIVNVPLDMANEKWVQVARFRCNVTTGTQRVGLGTRSTNTAGINRSISYTFDMSSGVDKGKSYIFTGNGATFTERVASTAVPLTNGDTVELTIERNGYTMTCKTKNVSTGDSTTISYDYPITSTSEPVMLPTSRPAVYQLNQANQTLLSWSFTDNTPVNPYLLVIGDSKTSGHNATSASGRFVSQLQSAHPDSVFVFSGYGDELTDAVKWLSLVRKVRPKNVVIALGSNDVRNGRSEAVILENISRLYEACRFINANVYFLGMGENTINQSYLWQQANNLVGSSNMILTYPSLAGDGVHLSNTAAHTTVKQAIESKLFQ